MMVAVAACQWPEAPCQSVPEACGQGLAVPWPSQPLGQREGVGLEVDERTWAETNSLCQHTAAT